MTGKILDDEETIKRLNELYDSNKQLKKENENLKQKVDFYTYFQKDARELEKENEQLKKENKKLQGEYDQQLWLYNGLGCEYDHLKAENEQLQTRLKAEKDIAMKLGSECDNLIIKNQKLELEISRLEMIIETGKKMIEKNEGWIVDDAETLIDMVTRENFDIVEEVVDILNNSRKEK